MFVTNTNVQTHIGEALACNFCEHLKFHEGNDCAKQVDLEGLHDKWDRYVCEKYEE